MSNSRPSSPTKPSGRPTSPFKRPSCTAPITQHPHLQAQSRASVNIRSGKRSSDDPATTTDADSGGEPDSSDDEDVPVRRAGFCGRAVAAGDETEEDSGFATAKEGSSASVCGGDDDDDEEPEPVDGKTENVVVCIRVRPSRASATSSPIYTFSPESSSIALAPSHPTFLKRGAVPSSARKDEYEFKCDKLLLSPNRTEELYEHKIKDVVRAAMAGFNGTVFAYGQTASGKTHTMMGTDDEPGVIPLAISELFDYIHTQNEKRTFSLRVAFLEIYNEAFRDLLATPPSTSPSFRPKPLDVHGEDGTVRGLEERPVSGPAEVLALLGEGEARRRTGATDWNERSSRSHVVFIVTIESMSKDEHGVARTSKLNLIDLAGSESATGQEERRKEGAYINKSLLTLGTVIGKLTERSAGPSHIPYRDSKLTRLLQPALSGKSRVAVICAISPDEEQATETLSTLKFAKRVKMVVTKAERGVFMTDQMMLKQYAGQVEQLQAQIKARELAVQDDQLAKERDQAIAKVDELQTRSKKTEDELALKELELNRLREQLAHTKSFILTGPSLEANARRASGQFAGILSPMRANRIVSDASGLGIGSPRGSSNRICSAITIGSLRVGSMEKEIVLEQQLEEAEKRIRELATKDAEVDALKTEITQLTRSSSLARIDADKSARANADRKQALLAVERQLDIIRAELSETKRKLAETTNSAADVEKLVAQLDEFKLAAANSSSSAEQQLITVRAELIEAKEMIRDLCVRVERQDEAAKADAKGLVAAKERAETAERRAEAIEAAKNVPDGRDERIEKLRYELAFVKRELGALVALHGRCGDKGATLTDARDAAVNSAMEAIARVQEVETLSSLEVQRHEVAQQQTAREKDAAIAAAEARVAHLTRALDVESDAVARLSKELDAKSSEAAHLQRTLDAAEALETQRKSYAANQRVGTDALKSRLADLQARSSTPVQSLSSSTRSASGAAKTESVELQVRNGELVSRVADLERQLREARRAESPAPPFASRRLGSVDLGVSTKGLDERKERDRLASIVDSQTKLLQQSQATGSQWRDRYLEAQRELERIRSGRNETENIPLPPRPTLVENVRSSTPPPLRRHHSSSTHSPQLSLSNVVPPPLPYSPQMKDKERALRRETIDRDMIKLKQSRGVERTKSLLDSPTTSPTKASFEGLPPAWSSARKAGYAEVGERGKKSSTDSARQWA